MLRRQTRTVKETTPVRGRTFPSTILRWASGSMVASWTCTIDVHRASHSAQNGMYGMDSFPEATSLACSNRVYTSRAEEELLSAVFFMWAITRGSRLIVAICIECNGSIIKTEIEFEIIVPTDSGSEYWMRVVGGGWVSEVEEAKEEAAAAAAAAAVMVLFVFIVLHVVLGLGPWEAKRLLRLRGFAISLA